MTRQMPKIDVDKLQEILDPKEFAIVRRIIATRGVNKGCLRGSKPKVQNHIDPLSGKSAYVWRMVAFLSSPNPQHACMPVTADFDLPIEYRDYEDSYEGREQYRKDKRAMLKELDELVDKVAATMPMSEGAMQWARGFGLV